MKPPIEKKLHELGRGIYAYTQLPGSWGWSNSGLVTDGGQTLLVDTLFDEKITGEMLRTMRLAAPAAEHIDLVVNTHGNGDHCYGNGLVRDAEIVATVGCAQDLRASPARQVRMLLRAARLAEASGVGGRVLARTLDRLGVRKLTTLLEAGELALPLFGDFDFSSEEVLPSRLFRDKLTLSVGDKRVELIEVGPAHTLGDAVVWVPGDRVLFTGDILFNEGHPVIWRGPVSNWTAALERLLALDVETVVPGHGPITDQAGLRGMLEYLQVLQKRTRQCYDAGLTVDEAATEIELPEYDDWLDAERIYVNVHTLYREFVGDETTPDVLEMFAGMSRVRARRERPSAVSIPPSLE